MPSAGADNSDRLLARLDELEAELRRVHHALDHHERLATLGTIAGLIAHEFNNILTPVMSYAQMALGRPEDRELTAKALHRAAEGAERASQIASAILGFVRDDGGETPAGAAWKPGCSTWNTGDRAATPPDTGPRADVADAVRDALACMGRELDRDLITLDLRLDPAAAAAMKPLALQHILLNLILNARAAMLPLGGRLAIQAALADSPPRPAEGASCSLDPTPDARCSTWNTRDAGCADTASSPAAFNASSAARGTPVPAANGSGGVGYGQVASETPVASLRTREPSDRETTGAAASSDSCSTWNIAARLPRPADATPDTHASPAPGWLVITVRDSGRGMRPDVLARIFEPFFTRMTPPGPPGPPSPDARPATDSADAGEPLPLRNDPAGRRRGTGLGMTMCRRLAEEVGGYLTVESAVGQGTTVTLALPAAPLAATAGAPATLPSPADLRKSA